MLPDVGLQSAVKARRQTWTGTACVNLTPCVPLQVGYLRSWSAYNTWRKQHSGAAADPLESFQEQLMEALNTQVGQQHRPPRRSYACRHPSCLHRLSATCRARAGHHTAVATGACRRQGWLPSQPCCQA
jgi:hypothetical protein